MMHGVMEEVARTSVNRAFDRYREFMALKGTAAQIRKIVHNKRLCPGCNFSQETSNGGTRYPAMNKSAMAEHYAKSPLDKPCYQWKDSALDVLQEELAKTAVPKTKKVKPSPVLAHALDRLLL